MFNSARSARATSFYGIRVWQRRQRPCGASVAPHEQRGLRRQVRIARRRPLCMPLPHAKMVANGGMVSHIAWRAYPPLLPSPANSTHLALPCAPMAAMARPDPSVPVSSSSMPTPCEYSEYPMCPPLFPCAGHAALRSAGTHSRARRSCASAHMCRPFRSMDRSMDGWIDRYMDTHTGPPPPPPFRQARSHVIRRKGFGWADGSTPTNPPSRARAIRAVLCCAVQLHHFKLRLCEQQGDGAHAMCARPLGRRGEL